jgi:hypothetical protein
LQLTCAPDGVEFSFVETLVPLNLGSLKYAAFIYLIFFLLLLVDCKAER